jgi:copper chaperone
VATTVLTVPDISCEHCVRTVTEALTPIEGVQQVSVNLPTKQVRVEYDNARVDIDTLKSVLAEEDYPVESVER